MYIITNCIFVFQALTDCNGSIDRELGKLLYTLATKLPKQFHCHLKLLTSYLTSKKIDQEAKLNAAVKFVQVSKSYPAA